MERGMAYGVLVSMVSFAGAVVTLAIIFTQSLGPDASAILSAIFVVLIIMFIVGLLLVVANSDDGFQVSGSTLEWMLAALMSPGWALLLYFFANPERDAGHADYIDINDEKRISRL
jgi:hypothetical protein